MLINTELVFVKKSIWKLNLIVLDMNMLFVFCYVDVLIT